jgi:4-amino-4-deoxy-L-arabinose transferase-like glycosyltransferase
MLTLQALPGAARLNGRVGAVAAVALISGGLLFTRLDDRDLWSSHEARAAQNAIHFSDTGHWGVLRAFDGTPDLQKPPLYYWLVAGIAWLRGGPVDATAVRLPAAAAGWLLTVLVSVVLLRRPVAALIAGLSLATACHFVAIARTARVDVPLALAVAVALVSLRARAHAATAAAIAGVAIAGALLLKGPVSLALILAAGLSIWSVNRDALVGPKACFVAVAFGITLAAPWFIAAILETNGEFVRVFFYRHNLQRAAGTADGLARHPVSFYLVRWMVDWLPWSPAVLAACWLTWRSGGWRSDSDLRFGAAWAAAMTVVLSLSQFKRADYLISAYAGVAIALGCAAERAYLALPMLQRDSARRIASATIVAVVAAYVLIEAAFMPGWDRQRERRSAAGEVHRHVPPGAPIVLFRVEDHLLTLHLGKPIATVVEWENLAVWLRQRPRCWVIMPACEAEHWSARLPFATLHEVARLPDRTGRCRPRDLVLLRDPLSATRGSDRR